MDTSTHDDALPEDPDLGGDDVCGGDLRSADLRAGDLGPDTVEGLLLATSSQVVETHLRWLVDQCHRCRMSPRRTLLEDQARLLIDALYQRDEFELVSRALDEPWISEFDEQSKQFASYAEGLGHLTIGQPEYSPYAALAQSAAQVLRAGARVGVR